MGLHAQAFLQQGPGELRGCLTHPLALDHQALKRICLESQGQMPTGHHAYALLVYAVTQCNLRLPTVTALLGPERSSAVCVRGEPGTRDILARIRVTVRRSPSLPDVLVFRVRHESAPFARRTALARHRS